MSFSTGFTSIRDDSVNAERAAEVGIEMEINLDGQSVPVSQSVSCPVYPAFDVGDRPHWT